MTMLTIAIDVNIVMISIATVIGPVLAAWLTARRVQPSLRPDSKNPSHARTLSSRIIPFWVFALLIFSLAWNVYSLSGQVRSTEPLTHAAVFTIAMSVGAVIFTLMQLVIFHLLNVVGKVMERQIDLTQGASANTGNLITVVATLTDRVIALEKSHVANPSLLQKIVGVFRGKT